MSPRSIPAFAKPGPMDPIIAVLAIMGIFAFIFILPSQHMDGLAAYELTESEAINRANVYLAEQGYNVADLSAEARLTRNDRLLEAMQEDIGRHQTIQVLRDNPESALPAFLWSVVYRMDDIESSSMFSIGSVTQVFLVSLSEAGDVLAFENRIPDLGTFAPNVGRITQAVNRSILSRLFSENDSLEAAAYTSLRAVPDSTFLTSLQFARIDAGAIENPAAARSGEEHLTDLVNGRPVELNSNEIVRLAALMAPERALSNTEWSVDSVYVIPGAPSRLARVRLLTSEPIHGQHFRVEMTLSSTGSLQSMDVVSNPDRPNRQVLATTFTAIAIGGYVLLAIILIVLFIRRIVARLIDVKGSMLDALLFGILFGLFVVLRDDVGIEGELSGWGHIWMRTFIFSVTGGATALFVFILAAATESITREVLPEKLHSSLLVRRGELHNQLVGWSLIRGVGVGGVLLGIGVLSLKLFPTLILDTPSSFSIDEFFRPAVSELAISGTSSYLILVFLLLGIGTFAYRISSKSWLMVALVTLSGGLLQVAPIGVKATGLAAIVSAAVALVLALTYVRYDFLTAFVGLLVAVLAWRVSEGFLVANSPAWLDTLLAVLFIVTVAVFGIAGIVSRHTGSEAARYVPQYIEEMAGQERIKRELEIAYQVQASFLPRTMPTIEGLDLAGMCLPASEIGGDYFDFIQLPEDRLAFVVGDVSGKGIQAAFYMTLVKGVIQTLSTSVFSPREVMFRLNQVFRRNAPAGTFISAIYGVVDPKSGHFTFARAGHNPAILMRESNPKPEFLRPNGMAIGFADGDLFENSIDEVSIHLDPGDLMVFYTDGFSEAMNSRRELYGDDRLLEKVGHFGSHSASRILRALTEDVHHFIEGSGRSDDMTMIVVRRSPV